MFTKNMQDILYYAVITRNITAIYRVLQSKGGYYENYKRKY